MSLLDILGLLRQQHSTPLRNSRFGWWPARSAFDLMVGAVLTQNTAWVNVEKSIARLREAGCLDAKAILALSPEQLAELIRSSGYYNVKQKRLRALCRWYWEKGPLHRLKRRETEELRAELLSVHGVGPETADDILLYALGRPVFVVDAYTRRVFSRMGLVSSRVGYEELRQLFERELPRDAKLYNEYHARIVLHGKRVCLAREPRCGECRLRSRCVYGQAAESS